MSLPRVRPGKYFMMGNMACADGAIAAGCEFAAGYPITPATEIANRLAERLPQVGGVFLQMEDEISSIAAIVGASWTGKKVMTATSGPGDQPHAGEHRLCHRGGDALRHRQCPAGGAHDGNAYGRGSRGHGAGQAGLPRGLRDHRPLSRLAPGDVRPHGAGLQFCGKIPHAGFYPVGCFRGPHARGGGHPGGGQDRDRRTARFRNRERTPRRSKGFSTKTWRPCRSSAGDSRPM